MRQLPLALSVLLALAACKPPAGSATALKADGEVASDAIYRDAYDVLRVEVRLGADGRYEVDPAIENTGTPALKLASVKPDGMGSFRAQLIGQDGKPFAYASAGIGSSYMQLARAVTFRFPLPDTQIGTVRFTMNAEQERSGQLERVIDTQIDPRTIERDEDGSSYMKNGDLEVRELKPARSAQYAIMNVYAEGYTRDERDKFWRDTVSLQSALGGYPGYDKILVRGVFAPSRQKFSGRNPGSSKPDTVLGLVFPDWIRASFPRWNNLVYPVNETYFRQGCALVPYDYPFALINSKVYFGMGNFKLVTAVPADHPRLRYLARHELGHFFGLNEEYSENGTELKFSPRVNEPWSPNISLQRNPKVVKWRDRIADGSVAPSPVRGGYGGEMIGNTPVFIPGTPNGEACTMDSGENFCAVCADAIERQVGFDAGAGLGN